MRGITVSIVEFQVKGPNFETIQPKRLLPKKGEAFEIIQPKRLLAILDHSNEGVRAEPTSDKLPTQRKTA